ncbi:MAG: MBL fold metallo-hydrolase [Chrysiogenales bacterium]
MVTGNFNINESMRTVISHITGLRIRLLFLVLAGGMVLHGLEEPRRSKEMAKSLALFQTCRGQFESGRELFEQGKLDDAALRFSACKARMPGHVYAWYYLANIHYLQQKYTEALAAIERAEAQLDPMMWLDSYAQEQRIKGMDDVAILLAKAYDATNSCMERLRIEEVSMQVSLEEQKARETAGRELLFQRDLKSEYACFHGNILFKLQRFDQALERYVAAVGANPRNGQAYTNIIAIYYLAKQYPEADRYLQEAEAAGIGDDLNLKLKVLVLEALGRPTVGILEQEYVAPRAPEGIRAVRFTANITEGQTDRQPLFENAYIAYDPQSRDALLIDPGTVDPRIAEFVRKNALSIRMILNTHGHFDHSSGNRHYALLYNVKIAVGKKDFKLYSGDAEHCGSPKELFPLSAEFHAGTILVQVVPTPGHTPGSACFLIGSFVFSGDSLFERAVGRMGAFNPAGRRKKLDCLVAELHRLARALPAETVVLPGHGRSSTLARVLEFNPFLR